MYLSRAESYDKERAESWKADADGILIFVRPSFRCISCVLQFKAGSEWSILCNCSGLRDRGTQESAAFMNESRSSVVLTFPNRSPFYTPTSALLTSTLWLPSLIVSLSCALLATLLQQWARCYLLITQSHSIKLHDRARIRHLFAEGVIKFYLPKVVSALPTLPPHICLFLSRGTPCLHL